MTGKFWLDLFCVIAFIVGTLIISVYGFVILTILVYLAKYLVYYIHNSYYLFLYQRQK